MAQWLRAFVVLLKDWIKFPTPTRWLTNVQNPRSKVFNVLSPSTMHAHSTHAHTQAGKAHTLKKKNQWMNNKSKVI